MGKDGIPDWLNSSLWSTTLSGGDDRIHRHSPSPTISSNAVSEPFVQPPVPVPPPAAASSPQSTATSPKSESRDRVDKNSDDNNNDNDQNASSSDSSPDDISHQAQLLTELLLGYLPPDRVQWSYELAKKRSEYKQFKEELLMNPKEMARKLDKYAICDNDHSESERSGLLSRSQVTHGEHPLSLGESSIWNQFF
ncbi:Detected protein of confused Function [Hibiscus syriacus]|uniref:Detected protein of confused Function n=1 Tax=Hibiscus syriacus TaxID=106335 RepID=A0A6A2ZHG4_HIBSY|nr:Detected protein of confused Function [Hibiscus syriacus]